MHNVAQWFDAAMAHHTAGELPQAVDAYRRVLAADPRHARAMHGLAMIALGQGEHQQAAQYATQAIGVEPTQADYYPTLAEAHRGLGQLVEAIACYQRAIAIQPDDPDAHSNLGTLFQAQGDLAAAADCYRRSLAARADYPLAHHNLAIVLQLQGDLDGAAAHFAEAARLNPAGVESQVALGYVLQAQGKHVEALRCFEDAVRKHPSSATAHCGLGYALQSTEKLGQAVEHYTRAVQLAPTFAMAHYNLATALRSLGRPAEALSCFEESLRHDPDFRDAIVGVAGVQLELRRVDEAVAAARRAVELAPNSHAAAAQLAAALHAQGDLESVIATNRRAIELNPADAGGHSNLLYALLAHEAYDAQMLLAEHRAWAARHADPLTPAAPGHENDPQGERRLRIGYVSAHFRQHAVSFFSEPLIAAHDRAAFEIYCYSDVKKPDEVTARFQSYADHWRDVTGMSDDAVAQCVAADRIDILVDLTGHIGGNRLLAFARKPAPVQVTYLGYQSTTGMKAMDYRLTDEHADPPGETDRFHTEKLVRLPRSFFCYAAPRVAPEVNELPALGSGCVTFGSLNQTIKLRPRTLQAWSRILAAVPNSRLLVLAYSPGQFERNMSDIMKRAGVDPQRVEVVNRRPHYEYLCLCNRIDVALDSFPFNGHTTVCDALWMGVPSIMLEGSSYASRFGGSVLLNVGLADLIARTPERYVELAVELAGQPQRLAEMRRTMRDRMRGSPLLDAAGFTRNLEEAYRRMWHDWCKGA